MDLNGTNYVSGLVLRCELKRTMAAVLFFVSSTCNLVLYKEPLEWRHGVSLDFDFMASALANTRAMGLYNPALALFHSSVGLQ